MGGRPPPQCPGFMPGCMPGFIPGGGAMGGCPPHMLLPGFQMLPFAGGLEGCPPMPGSQLPWPGCAA